MTKVWRHICTVPDSRHVWLSDGITVHLGYVTRPQRDDMRASVGYWWRAARVPKPPTLHECNFRKDGIAKPQTIYQDIAVAVRNVSVPERESLLRDITKARQASDKRKHALRRAR